MQNVHFIALNHDGDLILAQAEISADKRSNGFQIDTGWVPPWAIFDNELDGLKVLVHLSNETGLLAPRI